MCIRDRLREDGLKEVTDASSVFLQQESGSQEGSIVVGIIEGTRPILVEIQALASETKAVMPRRAAIGIDNQRLSLILAVLEKKLKIPFYNSDVYVNVVGGLNVEGTSGDLGLSLIHIFCRCSSRWYCTTSIYSCGRKGIKRMYSPWNSCWISCYKVKSYFI